MRSSKNNKRYFTPDDFQSSTFKREIFSPFSSLLDIVSHFCGVEHFLILDRATEVNTISLLQKRKKKQN